MGKKLKGESDSWYKEWSDKHTECQACGRLASIARRDFWPGLSTHHIIKRMRIHDATNLLRLCQRCHRLAEGDTIRVNGKPLPKLTMGVCLTLKLHREPREFDWNRLLEIRAGEALPDLENVPWEIEREYRHYAAESIGRFYASCGRHFIDGDGFLRCPNKACGMSGTPSEFPRVQMSAMMFECPDCQTVARQDVMIHAYDPGQFIQWNARLACPARADGSFAMPR